MTKNKQLVINMAASFIAYAVTFGISFFLSPYIVKNVGVDAYGFVGLANNFISYAGLITIALNSMAGRFVTVKIHEKDSDGANRYFSSVFIANLLITAFMGFIFVVLLVFLEHLINIPSNIFWDVKLLFGALFLNCLIGTIGSVFSIATFATNKLYLQSLRTIESNIIRAVIILALFIFLAPKVSFLGVTSLLCGIYVLAYNIYYTKKLLPQLKINRKHFDFKSIIELVSSGVWNLINRVGQLLLDGLDLLITNLFINPAAMGILSLSKTVPSIITSIVGSMVGVFSPNFTILYAEKKTDELLASVKQSMKIMGVIANLPIIVLIVCGDLFFSLWQPTQDATQLHILSILTCAGLIFNGGINCIYNIFTVVNKLKLSSLMVCLTGVISTITVFILLNTTNLGIYAVAGVSTTIATLRNLIFTVPYGAYCLGQKWYTFYPNVIRPVIFVALSGIVCYIIKGVLPFSGWFNLILLAVITVLISTLIGSLIILNKADRVVIKNVLLRRRKK